MAADATIHRGADVTFRDTIYSDVAQTVVRNLTGYGTPVLRIGRLNGQTRLKQNGTLFDAPNGLIDFVLTAAQTAQLGAGEYRLQVDVIDAGGLKQVATDGTLTVKQALVDIP